MTDHDEQADLGQAVADVDRRLRVSWPSSYTASGLLSHLRGELREIEQAVLDADGRPSMNGEVVEECGDAMLLLGRLAMMYGAKSALEPLALAVRKTCRRLEHFEQLVRSSPPAEAWRVAKILARRK
jgi:NTP pyrophosphatase (non-canonical NTP hydrolase)